MFLYVIGEIDISNKTNYPVISHKFYNPTNNIKLKSAERTSVLQQLAFWQINFTMPATVTKILMIANKQSDLNNSTLQLLGQSKIILKQKYLSKKTRELSYTGLPLQEVYSVKIIRGTNLALADIKIYGTQGKFNACLL